MWVGEYFSIDRFRAAGVEPAHRRVRMLTVFDRAGVRTMEDLFRLGKLGFLRRPGAGNKMCEFIERMLKEDDIGTFG